MKLYDSHISFKYRSCTFNLDYYIFEYLKHKKIIIIYSLSALFVKTFILNNKYKDIVEISTYIFIKLAERREN